jgi:inosine-uridine nucleoside N-ribohydrolase
MRPPSRNPFANFLLLAAAGGFVSGCEPGRTAASTPVTGSAFGPSISITAPPAIEVAFDDDGSPDGTTALLYLLDHPSVRLRSASISYGEAHPETYIQHVGRLVDAFGAADVRLGAGPPAPVAGTNTFPEWMRDSADGFWGLPLPGPARSYPVEEAGEMLASVIGDVAEPITVFISGPSTNLAIALRIDPSIRERVRAVYIMGGAVRVPGNIRDLLPGTDNAVAEWNVYADPVAAHEVLVSGLNVVMVPLDATNRVNVSREDTAAWRAGGPAADLAAEFYDSLMANWGTDSAAIWDLMTAAIMTDPSLCEYEQLAVDVLTDDGPTSGQTVIVAGGEPNVSVCMQPNVQRIKETLVEVFSRGG